LGGGGGYLYVQGFFFWHECVWAGNHYIWEAVYKYGCTFLSTYKYVSINFGLDPTMVNVCCQHLCIFTGNKKLLTLV